MMWQDKEMLHQNGHKRKSVRSSNKPLFLLFFLQSSKYCLEYCNRPAWSCRESLHSVIKLSYYASWLQLRPTIAHNSEQITVNISQSNVNSGVSTWKAFWICNRRWKSIMKLFTPCGVNFGQSRKKVCIAENWKHATHIYIFLSGSNGYQWQHDFDFDP